MLSSTGRVLLASCLDFCLEVEKRLSADLLTNLNHRLQPRRQIWFSRDFGAVTEENLSDISSEDSRDTIVEHRSVNPNDVFPTVIRRLQAEKGLFGVNMSGTHSVCLTKFAMRAYNVNIDKEWEVSQRWLGIL